MPTFFLILQSAIHEYKSTIDIEGENVVFKVVVRETNEGKLFYDHAEIFEPQHGKSLELSKNQTDQPSHQGSDKSITPKPKPDKIDDFGETLQGANKHNYTFNKKLNDNVDIEAVPLSK